MLVTEAAGTPNTGRVSVLDSGGNRRTVIDGLPSGKAAPDMSIDGPNGIALSGRTLYIANGEGDSHVNGPTSGSIVPNPAGPSSPMYATILQVNLSADVDKLASGFSLTLQNHFTLMDGNSVTLTNTSGDTATVSLLTGFRLDRPDPNTIYRNTHLFGLALLPAQPNTLYADDAGNNAIWKVDLTSGRSQLLIRFPGTPNPLAAAGGPPFSEAVPTSVRPYGDHLLVTLLSGAPFVPGASRVMEVDPATGTATTFMGALSSTIDIVFRLRADGSGQWFVLEYSTGTLATPAPAPGRLLVYTNPTPQIFSDGLATPTGLTLDSQSGTLYIVDRTDGTVSKVAVGN